MHTYIHMHMCIYTYKYILHYLGHICTYYKVALKQPLFSSTIIHETSSWPIGCLIFADFPYLCRYKYILQSSSETTRPRMEKSHQKRHKLLFCWIFNGLVQQKGSLTWLRVKPGVRGVSHAISPFLGGLVFMNKVLRNKTHKIPYLCRFSTQKRHIISGGWLRRKKPEK